MNLLGKDNVQCSCGKLSVNCVQFSAVKVLDIFNYPLPIFI